ncbi:MAG TPA: BlaI/MecI/CopY family transcriptional regulator [archaeon]|nr:BlaI/MecI/CopY family transcriptional regulator [archaeon]
MTSFKKIDLEKETVGVLSPLQSHILELLWKKDSQRVRHLYNNLKHKDIALTSIAVDLDRLHKKGMVSRTVEKGLGGPHYIYSVNKTKEEFQASILDNTVNKLIEKFGSVAVDYFNDRFAKKGDLDKK